MNVQKISGFAAILLALAVILGAFAAHALSSRFGEYELKIWEKASFYHFTHSLGLFIVCILFSLQLLGESQFKVVTALMIFGILVFSGSLYALAFTGIKLLGAITPFGGTALILSWLYLGFSLLKKSH
ncbi:MAG: DUF423 domain-containing protein [bacterium]|nr:DUF423 domain-containing protein [bacterium]